MQCAPKHSLNAFNSFPPLPPQTCVHWLFAWSFVCVYVLICVCICGVPAQAHLYLVCGVPQHNGRDLSLVPVLYFHHFSFGFPCIFRHFPVLLVCSFWSVKSAMLFPVFYVKKCWCTIHLVVAFTRVFWCSVMPERCR